MRNFIFLGLLGWSSSLLQSPCGGAVEEPFLSIVALLQFTVLRFHFDWRQNETQWKRAGFQAEARQEASQPSLCFYQQQNPPSRFPKVVTKSEGRMLQMSPKHLLQASFCKRAICFELKFISQRGNYKLFSQFSTVNLCLLWWPLTNISPIILFRW